MSSQQVGSSAIYEAGDQRLPPATDPTRQPHGGDRYHEGQPHSHKNLDSKDQRSLANKLSSEAKVEHEEVNNQEAGGDRAFEVHQSKKDATLPAVSHGNAPSKGARVDREIAEEEAEMMKGKKGSWGSKQ